MMIQQTLRFQMWRISLIQQFQQFHLSFLYLRMKNYKFREIIFLELSNLVVNMSSPLLYIPSEPLPVGVRFFVLVQIVRENRINMAIEVQVFIFVRIALQLLFATF